MSKIKNPKNIFVKLITFGNTFNSKTFFDNFKRYFIEFLGLFMAVTFSFYIESVGEEYEKKQGYKEIVSTIPSKIRKSINYTDEYLQLSINNETLYNNIIKEWEVDNDSVFIRKYLNKDYYPPLAYFILTNDYTPPILNLDLFKSGNQRFKMLYKEVSNEINQLVDGNQLNFILRIIEEEKKLTDQYRNLIYEDFGKDTDISNLFELDFWIKNRTHIQQNHRFKFLVYEKQRLIKYLIIPQVKDYKSFLERKLSYFDSLNNQFDNEKHFLYWKIN